jgi:hypothetical protein
MTQGDLQLTPPTVKPPRTRVRQVSVAQYAEGRARFVGRKALVLRWLAHCVNARADQPTSAELARWAEDRHDDALHDGAGRSRSWDALVLLTRRGLNDLQRCGLVEAVPEGQRVCAVTGHRCETWRVVVVGR